MALELEWLGRVGYRATWARQHELAGLRAVGKIGDRLLLVEHPAVLTVGRNASTDHVRATASELADRNIEVIRVERGGDVTYHGPGQLVAYPIVRLADRGILVRPFVRALEAAMIDTAATYGVAAGRLEGSPGCWCEPESAAPRKLGALGLRVERGVTFHGIALNVTTRLEDFALIDPCGMPGVRMTSISEEETGRSAGAPPTTASVAAAAERFAAAFAGRLREASIGGKDAPSDGLRAAVDSGHASPKAPAVTRAA